VAIETAQRLGGLAFGFLAREVFLGGGVVLGAGDGDDVQGVLELAVPPRLSRRWVRCPEEHGIGAARDCSAKLASERNCWLPAVWPIRIAASAPQPCSASSAGRTP
jgi:hypothetical protein